jgi:nitrite reductase/ring-hydroxylating ferredoxin subunit
LPLFEHRLGTGVESPRPARSVMTDDLGVICRWHESCFDLQTGEIRSWCHLLNEDGTPPRLDYLRDGSKNRCGLTVNGCHLHDGDLRISLS